MCLLYNSTGALFYSVLVKALINDFSVCTTDLKQQNTLGVYDSYSLRFNSISIISIQLC